jgi:hypothetical protein
MLECLQIPTRHKLSVLKVTVSPVSNYLNVISIKARGMNIAPDIYFFFNCLFCHTPLKFLCLGSKIKRIIILTLNALRIALSLS